MRRPYSGLSPVAEIEYFDDAARRLAEYLPRKFNQTVGLERLLDTYVRCARRC